MRVRKLGLAVGVLMLVAAATFLSKGHRQNEQSSRAEAADSVSLGQAPEDSAAAAQREETADFAKAKVQALIRAAAVPAEPKDNGKKSGFGTLDLKAPADQALERLVGLRHCERQAGNLNQDNLREIAKRCPVNHPEAREYAGGYAQVLVDQTVMELALLRELALAARSNGLNDPFDVGRIASVYIRHADDNVREQALALAEILPDTEGTKAMEIAVSALQSTVSGPLATQAIELLARHRERDPARADKAVVRALKSGGWDVKSAVAGLSLPFLTAENRAEFTKIMNAEPERSKLRLHLRLNLEEFDRQARL